MFRLHESVLEMMSHKIYQDFKENILCLGYYLHCCTNIICLYAFIKKKTSKFSFIFLDQSTVHLIITLNYLFVTKSGPCSGVMTHNQQDMTCSLKWL